MQLTFAARRFTLAHQADFYRLPLPLGRGFSESEVKLWMQLTSALHQPLS